LAARLIALASFVVRFPMSQPQPVPVSKLFLSKFHLISPGKQVLPLKIFTSLGVSATVKGTRMKMNDLWIA